MNKLLSALLFSLIVPLGADEIRELGRRGEEELLQHNYYRAIDSFKEALTHNANYVEALVGLSDSYYLLEEYKEALKYIELCLTLDRFKSSYKNRKARILTAMGRYEEASVIYKAVLESEKNNIDARTGMAEIRIIEGDRSGSLKEFEKALDFSPESRRLLLSMIVLYDAEKRYKESDYLVQQALKYHPGDVSVMEAAVRHYMKSGNYNAASLYAGELNTMVERDGIILLTAELHLITGQWEEALKLLTKYLRSVKNDPDAYYLSSVALSGMGEMDKSIASLKRALRIKPDSEIYRLFLENTIDDHYKLSDEKRKEYADWYLKQGQAREALYYYDKALLYYRRGLDLWPEYSELRYHFAGIQKKTGYIERYLKELKLVQDDPVLGEKVKLILEVESGLSEAELWPELPPSSERGFLTDFYLNVSENWEHHTGSGDILKNTLNRFLQGRPGYTVGEFSSYEGSFGDIYQKARKNRSDYFVSLSFSEGSRSFALEADLFLTSSGTLVHSFKYLRTGNHRIFDILEDFAADLKGVMPLKRSVEYLNQDKAWLRAGKEENLKEGDTFIILRKGEWKLSAEAPWVDPGAPLGRLTLTRVGEGISEGEIEALTPFNVINVKDDLFLLREEEFPQEKGNNNPVHLIDSELVKQLLKIH